MCERGRREGGAGWEGWEGLGGVRKVLRSLGVVLFRIGTGFCALRPTSYAIQVMFLIS